MPFAHSAIRGTDYNTRWGFFGPHSHACGRGRRVFGEIAAATRTSDMGPLTNHFAAARSTGRASSPSSRAAILIGAEVFGAAFAGGWALSILFGLETTGEHILQAVLFADRRRHHGRLHPRTRSASSRSRGETDKLQRTGATCMPSYAASAVSLTNLNIRSSLVAAVPQRRTCMEKTSLRGKKFLRSRIKRPISPLAQFRTCLWSCVSR